MKKQKNETRQDNRINKIKKILFYLPAGRQVLLSCPVLPLPSKGNNKMLWIIEKIIGWFIGLTVWDAVGFVGQAFFMSRFVVQWIVSERHNKSVVPTAFWYLSLLGSAILLVYSIHIESLVFIAGFSLNMIIYLRNLYFIHRKVEKQAIGSGQ